MRIYTQLKMRRFVADSDGAPTEVRISTHDAREYVTSLLASSSWAPEDSLLKHEFDAILKLAKSDGARLKKAENEERTVAVEGLGIIDPHKVSLAANALDLLLQIQHGTSLGNITPDQLVSVHDAHSGCWGLIVVDRASVQLRVRSGDVSVLREATEDILSVLEIREASASARKKQSAGEFLESHDGIIHQSNRTGEEEATGMIHVVSGFGLVAYAAWRPAPRTLFAISAGLVALSLLSVWAGDAGASFASGPWFAWGHATVDRVFTGTLGAALVVVVTTVQTLQRRRRGRGPRVLIRWGDSRS